MRLKLPLAMSVGTPMKAHHPMVARSVSCLTNHPSGKIDGSEVLVREPETGCSVIYVRVVHRVLASKNIIGARKEFISRKEKVWAHVLHKQNIKNTRRQYASNIFC